MLLPPDCAAAAGAGVGEDAGAALAAVEAGLPPVFQAVVIFLIRAWQISPEPFSYHSTLPVTALISDLAGAPCQLRHYGSLRRDSRQSGLRWSHFPTSLSAWQCVLRSSSSVPCHNYIVRIRAVIYAHIGRALVFASLPCMERCVRLGAETMNDPSGNTQFVDPAPQESPRFSPRGVPEIGRAHV